MMIQIIIELIILIIILTYNNIQLFNHQPWISLSVEEISQSSFDRINN
jgi:hypothetical protein